MLAEISASGVLTDKRIYARGKLPGYQSNANGVMRIEFTDTILAFGTLVKTIDIGTNNYHRLSYNGIQTMGAYDFELNKYYGAVKSGTYYYTSNYDRIFIIHESSGNYVGFTVAKSGGIVTLTFNSTIDNNYDLTGGCFEIY